MNSGTKTGAKIAHFGMTPGMIMSSRTITRMKPMSSGSAPMSALLEQVGQLDGGDRGDVASS